MSGIRIPISPGEFIDRLTILEIKSQRISDPTQRANIDWELEELTRIEESAELPAEKLSTIRAELWQINQNLWDAENAIRQCEARGDFGEQFTEIARAIYSNNDRRSDLKNRINRMLGSTLNEEKSYNC